MQPSIRPTLKFGQTPLTRTLFEAIEKMPGVEEVEGRRIVDIRARRGDENWQNLTLIGVSDFANDINLLIPIEGTQFPGEDEVIVSQNMMYITGFHVGDSIEIELPDGSNHRLTVVGLVTDQTTSKPDPNSTNNAYITLKTLRSFGVDRYFNRLYVTVDGDGSDSEFIASVAAKIKDKVEDSRREVYRRGRTPFQRTPDDGHRFWLLSAYSVHWAA